MPARERDAYCSATSRFSVADMKANSTPPHTPNLSSDEKVPGSSPPGARYTRLILVIFESLQMATLIT